MKFIATLIGLLVALAVIVIGIGTYLSPDGLRNCKTEPTTEQDCGDVDAIVAISGGDTSARTAQAISLYKNGWAKWLVFSGAAADKAGPSNAETMKRQAIQEGVASSSIIIDETSETTKENAANTSALMSKYSINSVILVTSAYHQRRAGLEFGARAGLAIKVINHPVASDNQWSSWWWTTPVGWWLALSELFKIAVFYIGGAL
ncbi:MAG: YdcF family protein [Candidatus Saccharimonadales bacterium]